MISYKRLMAVWLGLLLQLVISGGANAQEAAPITNGSAAEVAAVQQLLGRLERAVVSREITTLRFYGLDGEAAQYPLLTPQTRATHLAFSPAGVLVRQNYRIHGSTDARSAPSLLTKGTHELWLARTAGGSFSFTSKRWSAPYDAIDALSEAANEEWLRPVGEGRGVPLLHLVATRRGGRWIALRRSRWEGALMEAPVLARTAQGQNLSAGDALDREWLRAQMKSAPRSAPGIAHFVFQRGQSGWVGLGMAWDVERRMGARNDVAASDARAAMLGTAYTRPAAHRAFGIALAQVGLFNEAADALEKAEALEPGIVDAALLKQISGLRSRDPEALAATELDNEARVGLDPNHPSYLVRALLKDYETKPTVLRALRMGLEYSRLGHDEQATAWLRAGQDLIRKGALKNAPLSEQQWSKVLSEHLQERHTLSAMKPPVTIRSPLFTLRCWPNTLSAVQVLAALEAAQHTVYADFGIPMSSTEVLLWRSQREFQNYVTRFSDQGHSEFVAALTLTKLIATREGPVVLGEEVNVFTDSRTAVFSTVAHEYGHVAVRQLSRGRDVPTWFNEGVAASVEGGYDGYVERVRNAATIRALLPMNEMLQWDVDGERAFLAYSQANSIIDYIVATWGKDAILKILRAIGTDQKPDVVFQNVLGISQHELWRRWARQGIK